PSPEAGARGAEIGRKVAKGIPVIPELRKGLSGLAQPRGGGGGVGLGGAGQVEQGAERGHEGGAAEATGPLRDPGQGQQGDQGGGVLFAARVADRGRAVLQEQPKALGGVRRPAAQATNLVRGDVVELDRQMRHLPGAFPAWASIPSRPYLPAPVPRGPG